jgi:hypothetical protein
MPENMHLHLEKVRRWLKIEPDSVPGMLKRMSPFGFDYSLKSDPEEPGEDPDDMLLALRWVDMMLPDDPNDPPPDEDFVMTVVVGTLCVNLE